MNDDEEVQRLDRRFVFIFLLGLGSALFLNGLLLYNLELDTALRIEIWLGIGMILAALLGIGVYRKNT